MKLKSVWKRFTLILAITLFIGACEEPTTSPSPIPDDGRDPTKSYLLVKNFSSQAIYAVYCADSSAATWGDDLLGSEVMVSGSEKEIAVEPATRDIRVDTQATQGTSNGAHEKYGVLFEAGNTVELPLYDP